MGTTTKTLATRLRQHIAEAVRFHRTYKERGILSLLSIGLAPIIEEIESGVGDGWDEAERRWIAFYRAQGARLWNATEGGEGVTGETARLSALDRWAGRTPEQRSAIAQKVHANETPEQRAEWMKKARESQTREQLSANGKRGGKLSSASQTPEQLSARSSKSNKTRWVRMTPEERSAHIEARLRHTPERRKAFAQERIANSTPEQRSAACRKGWETRRQKASSDPVNQL